jgi:ankyrin repeat protein
VTPLMAAAGSGHGANPTRGRFKTDEQGAECAKLLIEAGVNPNEAVPRSGATALHAAAQHGWTETIKVLVAKGADLELADSQGLRAYDHARGNGGRSGQDAMTEQQKATAKVLRDLVFAKTGKEPQEFKPVAAPGGGRGPGGPGRGAGGPPGAAGAPPAR